jgi:hypothetical protein
MKIMPFKHDDVNLKLKVAVILVTASSGGANS